ncbi:small ribosomal subunit protein uS3y-like [Apium graveolens]|uniref:small ribosomal subunit protein uS3y-like n=1 Tax=Apium graveolens TaxID=4045 RepID=UPI003D7B7EFB
MELHNSFNVKTQGSDGSCSLDIIFLEDEVFILLDKTVDDLYSPESEGSNSSEPDFSTPKLARSTNTKTRARKGIEPLPLDIPLQQGHSASFIADGVFFAELNEVLTRELAEDGYSGVEIRVTPMRTDIIIRATRTQNVFGKKGRRIREVTSLVQKRFKFPENSVELYAEKVNNRGLCAIAQAESLRYKLLGGLAVRRACYGVLRFIMESGAKSCEVIVSGKLRAQRAKSMKFKDGYMISSGHPVKEYIDSAVRHVLLRQVKIMLAWDPKGKQGPMTPLPDLVSIHPPKEDEVIRPSTATTLLPLTADIDMGVAPIPSQLPIA